MNQIGKYLILTIIHSGIHGPPGFPGPSSLVNVTKGPSGLLGGKGQTGQPGFEGNEAVT